MMKLMVCVNMFLYFSALDAESERVVQEALDQVSRGKAETLSLNILT